MAAYARRRSLGNGCQELHVQEEDDSSILAFPPLKQARLTVQAKLDQLRPRHRPTPRRRACFAVLTFAAPASGDHSSQHRTSAAPAMDLATTEEGDDYTVKEPAGVPAWRVVAGNCAAGALAGSAVEAALYPIDTIKTRLQSATHGGGLRALLQRGGGKALYAGIWGNLVGVAPASAIFMAVYTPVKQYIQQEAGPSKNWLGPLGAGATAGVAASLVRVPTEVVKQRLQLGEFKSALTAVGSIAMNEGPRGLFAGYQSFLLRDLPFDAIEFLAYEQLKVAYTGFLKGERRISPLETSAIGATAGAITGVATTPLDVIKTRLMTQGRKRTYTGVVDCARKVLADEGPSAFLKGWQARVLWISLGGCVFFTALEEAQKAFAVKDPAKYAAA